MPVRNLDPARMLHESLQRRFFMSVFNHCCCGIDVHLSSIKANLKREGVNGEVDMDEIRKFGTMTRDLLALADWLKEAGCTIVAIESTGVLWKPVFNILEPDFEVMLINPKHYKSLPGQKTDAKDCRWLCTLLQLGLLKPSFIAPQAVREARDLTRHRRRLVEEKTRFINRIHKVLQDGNIKLSSVISDIMGKSGIEMLKMIIKGEADAASIAQCARGRMKVKIEQLIQALNGRVTEHHRFMLTELLDQISILEKKIELFDARIAEHFKKQGEEVVQLITLLKTLPGVDKESASEILAEIGWNMNQFPTEEDLSSWAGMCPGNNETGGKRKKAKRTNGSKWLQATLGEIAWAASRTKKTYLKAQYRRLSRRMIKQKAIVAVGHTMLVMIYNMIKYRLPYKELGEEYFIQTDKEKLTRMMVHRLEKFGYTVHLIKKEEDNAA